MPTYIRPARVDITESAGTGGLRLIAAGVAAAAAVVAFVLAHLVLLGACAAVFMAVMGGVIAWMRWAASPKRLRRHYYPSPTVRVLGSRPAQALSAPRRAIGVPKVTPAQVISRARSDRMRP